jgi:hypothetical protein
LPQQPDTFSLAYLLKEVIAQLKTVLMKVNITSIVIRLLQIMNLTLQVYKQIGTGVLLWSIPLTILYLITNDFEFWFKLSVFFTKSAFVTFGCLCRFTICAQVSVEQFHWLTNLQMIDGLALGETTPAH